MKRLIFNCLILTLFLCCSCFYGCKRNVTVNLQGGEIDIQQSEKIDVEQIINSKPTKEGYIFAGWYTDPEFKCKVASGTNLNKVDELYAKWISKEPIVYSVRSEEATITDSGRINQKMDKVDLFLDFDYEALMSAGYHYLKFDFSMDYWETYDGYQYVFFYSNTSCKDTTNSVSNFVASLLGINQSDPSLLASYKFEHSPGERGYYTRTGTFSATLPIELLNKSLYIRYGASGEGEDTWHNNNIYLKVTIVES